MKFISKMFTALRRGLLKSPLVSLVVGATLIVVIGGLGSVMVFQKAAQRRSEFAASLTESQLYCLSSIFGDMREAKEGDLIVLKNGRVAKVLWNESRGEAVKIRCEWPRSPSSEILIFRGEWRKLSQVDYVARVGTVDYARAAIQLVESL